MMDKFLGRTVYDDRTATYSFKDGSGVVPAELKQEMLIALAQPCGGFMALSALWKWKEPDND